MYNSDGAYRRRNLTLAQYPVIVTPNKIEFSPISGGTIWNTEVLTIFNPYTFPIHFKILGTRSDVYQVTPCDSEVPAGKKVTVTIRIRQGTRDVYNELMNGKYGNQSRRKLTIIDRFMIEQSCNPQGMLSISKIVFSSIIDLQQYHQNEHYTKEIKKDHARISNNEETKSTQNISTTSFNEEPKDNSANGGRKNMDTLSSTTSICCIRMSSLTHSLLRLLAPLLLLSPILVGALFVYYRYLYSPWTLTACLNIVDHTTIQSNVVMENIRLSDMWFSFMIGCVSSILQYLFIEKGMKKRET